MRAIEVHEPGKVNILALMLQQILDRNLQDPRKCRLMENRTFTVRIQVKEMVSTLFFEVDRIRLEEGAHGKPDIEIAGSMQIMIDIVLGANPLRSILRRHLRFRPRGWKGWFLAPRLLLLLQLGPPPAYLKWYLGKDLSEGGP